MTSITKILAALVALAAIAAGVLGWGAHRYNAGVQAGRAAVLADDARAAAQAQIARDALASASLAAGHTLTLTLDRDLPAVEAGTHATQATIRTIYLDRPAADVQCSRPDRVQQQLNAAIARANAAATGHL